MTTRIYYNAILIPESNIFLSSTASHHVTAVLRMRVGDSLIVFNGIDGEYLAEITEIKKNKVTVYIKQFQAIERESPLQIHLAQGIARGEKMDFIIQKATELGVAKITPLFTEFSNVKLPADRLAKKIEHWRAVAISACEQSGRNQIPEIAEPQKLTTWLPQAQEGLKIILNPEAGKNTKDLSRTTAATLLIGPEGGLNEQEVAAAQQNNFIPVKLGPRILRTETAGLAMIAILQALWGDIG